MSVCLDTDVQEGTQDLPGGPVVKTLPANAEDVGAIPGSETKIPHAEEQLSLCSPTRETQEL